MKKFIIILISAIMVIGCTSNCSQYKNLPCKYNIEDMYNLIGSEKDYLYENRIDTVYFVDSLFSYLANYRTKLLSILKEEDLPINFDKAFLIENFFVYKIGVRKSIVKSCPYDYRAVIYFENSKCKTFLDIDISKDCKKYNVDRIHLNTRRDTMIGNWLSEKTEFDRQNLQQTFVDQWEDQYDIVSKLNGDEKFCRILVNYFWSGFYGISEKPMTNQQFKNWDAVGKIQSLTNLTGNGFAF